ncbi:hypothetical protein [Bacillus sp. Hm123]|uniref:hypothetical protein n=1 Tax=Bacillus sp. Hm123 TaxID=3450745 RepID=UPI003F420870
MSRRRSWTQEKRRALLAAYGLERADRDKGNTMNDSKSMLTYRKEEHEKKAAFPTA